MKTAIVFMAVIAFAAAAQIPAELSSRSISSMVVDAIEGMRDQMPCGFPDLGIPPLAPLKFGHKEVNINTPAFSMRGALDNFRLNGLNDFDVTEMNVNAIFSKVTFRFDFRNVNVDTNYDLAIMLKKAGFTINMVGAGPAKFAIKDMAIWGTMKYSLGVLSGKLKLKTLDVRTHIGEVDSDIEGMLGEGMVNEKLNEVLAEAVETAVNENEDMIAETIESNVVPAVNSVLDDMTLAELISSVGGDGGDGSVKQECIPVEE